MIVYFQILAAGPASLIGGMVCVLFLLATRRHRDGGRIATPRVVSAFLFGVAGYVFGACVVGQFLLNIPVSQTIELFGNNRIAWLFLGIVADLVARLYNLFDPE